MLHLPLNFWVQREEPGLGVGQDLFQKLAVGTGIGRGLLRRGAHLHSFDHDRAAEASGFQFAENGFREAPL